MTSFEDVEALLEAASTAILGGDYATARTKVDAASVLLPLLPTEVQNGGQRIQRLQNSVEAMFKRIDEGARRTSGGFRQAKTVHREPRC